MGVSPNLLTVDQISAWAAAAQATATQGQVNQRIALLACCQPDWLALQVDLPNIPSYRWGCTQRVFALMSVVKPFLLLYLLEHYGFEQVFRWVGHSPSNAPFNDLGQLQLDNGHPRNPMINSGALLLADKLPGQEPSKAFHQWLNRQTGSQLQTNPDMLNAVKQSPRDANLALLHCLAETGQLKHPDQALDSYECICCLSGSIDDLARLGHLLAFDFPLTQTSHRRAVNAVMLTCGLYEASARYAITVGLPMKSGISGALLAVVPQKGVIATYGPALDRQGNSVAGLNFVTRCTQALHLSLFG